MAGPRSEWRLLSMYGGRVALNAGTASNEQKKHVLLAMGVGGEGS